jgi:hypothetical protein
MPYPMACPLSWEFTMESAIVLLLMPWTSIYPEGVDEFRNMMDINHIQLPENVTAEIDNGKSRKNDQCRACAGASLGKRSGKKLENRDDPGKNQGTLPKDVTKCSRWLLNLFFMMMSYTEKIFSWSDKSSDGRICYLGKDPEPVYPKEASLFFHTWQIL